MIRLLKRPLFWVLLLPLALIACTPILVDQETPFHSNDLVKRKSLDVETRDGPIQLSYLTAGTGSQRVIFVHGTPGDAAGSWLHLLEKTPDGFEYIAVDRPGFAFTTPRKAFTSLTTQAEAILPLLKTKHGLPPILVGHSLGGPVVAKMAVMAPDQVGAVIELAGALDPDLEEVLWVQYLGRIPPFTWLLPDSLNHANQELIHLEEELVILQAELEELVAPTVIIHGTADELVPYANVPYMQTHFTNSRQLEVVRLEDMNHFLPWSSADLVEEWIIKLAQRLQSEDATITAR